ncbi:hypothetical protein GCM10009601_60840 [Streptomyces thermospinosisporus]|uniref:Uncharacterized protein n=1 Tax=Streptomyces thermospinosisporus TaxID=161482 RepID=A0ABP4JY62_9ACTN
MTITVYAPGASGVASRTAPSASASARSTCVPLMSVTVTTACDTAHPSLVRILAVSPIPFLPAQHTLGSKEPARDGPRTRNPPGTPARRGPGSGYSPGWASSMSWPSMPCPATVRAVATGG